MKNIFRRIATALTLAGTLVLAACSTPSSYNQGLHANVTQYKLYNAMQMAQLLSVQTCFQFSTNTTECSIILAGMAPVQTLGGKPEPLRVAKSPGEIFESIASKGLDATVAIYGITAVKAAFEAQAATATASAAASASTIDSMAASQASTLNNTVETISTIAEKVPVTIPAAPAAPIAPIAP